MIYRIIRTPIFLYLETVKTLFCLILRESDFFLFVLTYAQKVNRFHLQYLDEFVEKYAIFHVQGSLTFSADIRSKTRDLTVGVPATHITLPYSHQSLSTHSRNLCALISRDARGQASSWPLS